MSEAIADFGAKLTLVLKQLSQSRGRLASTIGVHKSLVGRWAAGAVRPSEHNLALITQFVQRTIPNFSLLSWEEDLPSFAALIGATNTETSPPPAVQSSTTPDTFCGHAFRAAALSRAETARLGHPYPGVYGMYRQAFNNSGAFIVELLAIRGQGEQLTFRCTDGGYEHEGTVLCLRGQLFLIGEERERVDEFYFLILNGIAGRKALRLDGILLSVAGDRTHTPGAMVVVLERVGELAPGEREDEAAWAARRAEIMTLNRSGRGVEQVPPVFRAALENRVGIPREGGGMDWVLRVPGERSLSLSDADAEVLAPPGTPRRAGPRLVRSE
jgi:hypothetical protein